MKKILLPAMALMALAAVSCTKERQCKCETTDITDDGLLKIVTIDGSMSCDDIKEMGFEVKYVTDDNQQSLRREEMHTVTCREYGQ